jgi:hypothetical protein
MSEAIAKKPLPSDFPTVEPTAKGVNIRKALAGIHLLNGEGSQTRCLVKAGFSRATARNLTLKGLGAKECIAEAAKLDAMANPAKMLEAGRARAMLSIQACDPSKVPLKDAMKMLDTIEKYYGGHELASGTVALNVADRLSSIVALLVTAKQRGLPVPELPASFIDAEVLEPVATRPKQDEPDAVTR